MPLELGQRVTIVRVDPDQDPDLVGRTGVINSVDDSMEPLLPPLYGVMLTSDRHPFQQVYLWEPELTPLPAEPRPAGKQEAGD